MIDKTVLKENRRLLVKSDDPFLTDLFLSSLQEFHGGMPLKVCQDVESFAARLGPSGLFESKPVILALRNLTDEAVEVVAPLIDYSDSILVFVEVKALKKVKAYQTIRTACGHVKLEALPARSCKKWLLEYMVGQGVKMKGDVPGKIIELKGRDLAGLASEVKKLKLLCGGKEVTVEMCEEIVVRKGEANTYELADALIHKKAKPLLEELDKVAESEYIQLIHFLLKYVERFYKVAIYRSQKRSTTDIVDLMGLPKFVVTTKYYTALSVFPKSKILKLMDILNELDLQLRLTKMKKRAVFEAYILMAMRV